MTREEIDIQKEIEKYFTESAGFGRDKIQNFMDIVNKALKQKGEQIAELEKEKCELLGIIQGKDKAIKDLEKENAELKGFKQDCIKLTEDNVVMTRQRAETAMQLTKAKEIINKLIELVEFLNEDNVKEPIIEEAEQFLKDGN